MVLNLPEMENLFPHSKELYQGLGKIRIGQLKIIVALDGSGDTSDIQEGINMLPSGGGVVYIKEGNYIITSPITIASNNVSIIGAGKSTKIITTGNIRAVDIGWSESVVYTGVVIADLFLYGSGTGNINIGISTIAHHSLIDNVWIENFGDKGIVMDGITLDNVISFCNIKSNVGIGIMTYGNRVVIVNNTILENNVHGISARGNYLVISRNHVYDNVQRGISLAEMNDGIISGNVVHGNDSGNTASYDGINLVENCDNCVVANNRCKDNDRYEINIDNANCDKNIIIGNQLVGTDHVGEIRDAGTDTEIINKQIDIDHDSITNTHNLTTDIDHDSITSGTIADHDTSATGAELDTLTDNSMGDTLHRHSELSASDGTPDAALVLGATGILSIKSADLSNSIQIYHDNTNPYFKWDDGILTFQTEEATNTNTMVYVKGKGTGRGQMHIYDENNAEYLRLTTLTGHGYINTAGTSPGRLYFQLTVPQDIKCWNSIASGNPYLYIYGWDAGTSSVQYSRMNVDASGDMNIDIQSGNLLIPNGNVGIGTASPGVELEIEGTGEVLRLKDSSATGSPKVSFYQSNSQRAYIEYQDTGDILRIDADADIQLAPNNTGSLWLDRDGSVGIGTASPSAPLNVMRTSSGTNTILSLKPPASGNDLYQDLIFEHWSYNANPHNLAMIRNTMRTSWGGELSFWTMAASDDTLYERMTILNTGNVGIGDATPSYKLDVTGRMRSTLGRVPAGSIHKADPTPDEIFDALAPSVPSTNDEIIVNGALAAEGDWFIVSKAIRTGANTIDIYVLYTTGIAELTMTNGDEEPSVSYISISW